MKPVRNMFDFRRRPVATLNDDDLKNDEYVELNTAKAKFKRRKTKGQAQSKRFKRN